MTERIGTIAYERTGVGDPLVLIHGLGGTKLIWKQQLEHLEGERDVIAVDMPGFGDSPPLEGTRPTAAALAAAISELCSAIGIERPHVAGNSLGAWVALEMAKAGNAASLCLFSPAGLWRKPLGPRRTDSRAHARRLRPLLLALTGNRRARKAMLGTTLGRPGNVPPEDARELIRAWIDAPGYDAANHEMRTQIFEDPKAITVPTTIAWGELDTLVAPPKPERRPPDTRFLVLERCGHTPNWDDPELIARLLLEASATGAGAAAA